MWKLTLLLSQLLAVILWETVMSAADRQGFTKPTVDHIVEKDRLTPFYQRISKNDVKYCEDKTKLLPRCDMCIPGLQQGVGSEACNEYIPSSRSIRDEIRKLVVQRYGSDMPKEREFGLYPCKSFLFSFAFVLCTLSATSHVL